MPNRRIKMKLRLEKQDFKNSFPHRTISEKDIPLLGALMLASYRGTVDYEGETLQDAIKEVEATIHGKYGPFITSSSFLIEVEKRMLSATMIIWSEKMQLPLVAFSMTHPDGQNQGMATFLIKKSINTLHTQGYKELYLVVTEKNAAAYHVYEKLGFRPFED